MTPLDSALSAMLARPEAEDARTAFYAQLATTELYLLLASEPEGEDIEPRSFDLAQGPAVLAFDREERLTAFTDGPAPYAALSGRTLAALLAPTKLALGLNFEVPNASILLPGEAMAWLAEITAPSQDGFAARISELRPPQQVPEALLSALDMRLSATVGLAPFAALAWAEYEDGTRAHLLAFVGAIPAAEAALRQIGSEALAFSGLDAGFLDVVFVPAAHTLAQALRRNGLCFDMPQAAEPSVRPMPGGDKDKPPILR